MSSIHRKNEVSVEPTLEEIEETEIDGAQGQDVSSLDETSSISGSEGLPNVGEIIEPPLVIEKEPPKRVQQESFVPTHDQQPIAKLGSYNVKLMSESKLLFFGIILTVLLAFFSGLLLFKINAIEQRDKQTDLHFMSDTDFTAEAESILNRNLLIVKNIRKKLEELQEVLLKGTFEHEL